MEAAIRWSPHSTPSAPRFAIVDVYNQRLRLCEPVVAQGKLVRHKQISQRERLGQFTAFDWSKTQETVVAIGTQTGEATLVFLDPAIPYGESIKTFPIKHQRICNSIAFSTSNLLATGLARVRNDCCMNIYDLASPLSPGKHQEPYRKLASSEAIPSIKFFNSQPQTLIAGVAKQCIRLYDLRDSAGSVIQLPTRQVHNLAIDPLDENVFISAGQAHDPTIAVWDRRFLPQGIPTTPTGGPLGAVLEVRPLTETHGPVTVLSLRFSGAQRGKFGVLSNSGEIKIIELAQHSGPSTLPSPSNRYGGSEPWTSRTYARYTHMLTPPWDTTDHRHEENSRILAYDFMSADNPVQSEGALALHPDRSIEVLRVPSRSAPMKINALDELQSWASPGLIVDSQGSGDSVAADVKLIHADVLQTSLVNGAHDSAFPKVIQQNYSEDDEFSGNTTIGQLSSYQAHCRLMYHGFPDVKLSMEDTLRLQGLQRRRCFEGYLFNHNKNKAIVSNDPWLVELWDTVKRLQELAKDNGMTMDGIDMSYLGVSNVLNDSLGANFRNRLLGAEKRADEAQIRAAIQGIVSRKGYPTFNGAKTTFPEHRQLCLAICGWTFHREALKHRCLDLVERNECYKAIALCVFRGKKDLALEILKTALTQKRIQMIGLGAIILCEYVNEEQRELCQWMSSETDDVYLKALMAYFVTGDWTSVANMEQLPLIDRVSVALKYFEDDKLHEFVKMQMSEAIVYSNVEGIVLTGLADKAMDLFEHYIRKYNDIQTAVLVTAHANPMYLKDNRFDAWRDTYFMQMQAWRAFTQRARLTALHNRMSVTSHGKQFVRPPERQVTLRCLHCQQNMALHPLKTSVDESTGDQVTVTSTVTSKSSSPSLNAGTLCPQCKRPMPRCGICMLWLGSPDPARPGGAAAIADKAGEKPKGVSLIEKMIVWCMKCSHGFHGGHAREWFSRHRLCAVPDCDCICGVLH